MEQKRILTSINKQLKFCLNILIIYYSDCSPPVCILYLLENYSQTIQKVDFLHQTINLVVEYVKLHNFQSRIKDNDFLYNRKTMHQQFINGAYIFYPCHEVSLVAKLVFIRPIAEQSGNMAEIICNL